MSTSYEKKLASGLLFMNCAQSLSVASALASTTAVFSHLPGRTHSSSSVHTSSPEKHVPKQRAASRALQLE